jgi:hypothetical protein
MEKDGRCEMLKKSRRTSTNNADCRRRFTDRRTSRTTTTTTTTTFTMQGGMGQRPGIILLREGTDTSQVSFLVDITELI